MYVIDVDTWTEVDGESVLGEFDACSDHDGLTCFTRAGSSCRQKGKVNMKRSNVSTSSALRAAGGIASNFRFWRSGADSDISHINGVQY